MFDILRFKTYRKSISSLITINDPHPFRDIKPEKSLFKPVADRQGTEAESCPVSEKIIDLHQPDAPGQLESHYAPRTPLVVLERGEEFVPEAGRRYGLLSYRGEPRDGYIGRHEWAEVEVLSPGRGKLAEAAVRFFYALRRLDESGVDCIVAEPVSEVGLGRAIMDRLRRAAA